MTRVEAASVVVIGIVLVATGSLWFGERQRAAPPPSPAPPAEADAEREPAPPLPEPVVALPEEAAAEEGVDLPALNLADLRDMGTGESPEVLARMPTTVDYPLEEKYRGQSWSSVDYELVAAHDGTPEAEGEGPRRLFIAVVEPGLSDERVERLVRDIRARHRGAETLRIRVFDSKQAALTPSWTDAGDARKQHLVADFLREPGRERMLIRGREVQP
ncbi:MAG: hypothetical protein ACQGVC_00105 [Myxococcota bacterium]